MAVYSTRSRTNLDTCNPRIVGVFKTVLPAFDHSIIEGGRTLERQEMLFRTGKSKTMQSKHLILKWGDLSDAVDAVPYPHSWAFEGEIIRAAKRGDEIALMKVVHSVQRWGVFVGHVLMAAHMLKVPLRWGGDWDRDLDLTDQNFDDWPHFELIGS